MPGIVGNGVDVFVAIEAGAFTMLASMFFFHCSPHRRLPASSTWPVLSAKKNCVDLDVLLMAARAVSGGFGGRTSGRRWSSAHGRPAGALA